jgi:hypothetical protein
MEWNKQMKFKNHKEAIDFLQGTSFRVLKGYIRKQDWELVVSRLKHIKEIKDHINKNGSQEFFLYDAIMDREIEDIKLDHEDMMDDLFIIRNDLNHDEIGDWEIRYEKYLEKLNKLLADGKLGRLRGR